MKLIIVSSNNKQHILSEIALELSELYDMNVATHFYCCNDRNAITVDELNNAYKNNALLSCCQEQNGTFGITMDEYYNSDIIYVSIEEFNTIAEYKLKDSFIVFVEDEMSNYIDNELLELKYFLNFLYITERKMTFDKSESKERIVDSIKNLLIND